MRIIALDFGHRRIGVATTDPTGTIVRGVSTIDRKVHPQYTLELQKIFDELQPEKVIFGLPLGPDDEETEMCVSVRNFQKRIYEKLSLTLPFDFQDESFSSVRTQSLMRKTSTKKKRAQKGNIDRIAACIILEDYIRESSGSPLLY